MRRPVFLWRRRWQTHQSLRQTKALLTKQLWLCQDRQSVLWRSRIPPVRVSNRLSMRRPAFPWRRRWQTHQSPRQTKALLTRQLLPCRSRQSVLWQSRMTWWAAASAHPHRPGCGRGHRSSSVAAALAGRRWAALEGLVPRRDHRNEA